MLPLSSWAEPGQVNHGIEGQHGWWWYQKEPVKPKKKETKKTPDKKIPWVPDMKDYTMKELWAMHPDQFRPLMKAFLEEAVQNPTPENVKNYYVMMDIARRKSLAFTNVAAYVWQKDPDLSTAKDYPIASPGQNAMVRQETSEVENIITNAKDNFALLYFYSPT